MKANGVGNEVASAHLILKNLILKAEIFRTAVRSRGAVRAISATTSRMFPLSLPHYFTGHKNNATIEFFCKRMNATVLIKRFNLTASGSM